MSELEATFQKLASKTAVIQEDSRQIAQYDFEDGGFVRIVSSPDIETEDALGMVETMIQLKRAEIARRKERIARQLFRQA